VLALTLTNQFVAILRGHARDWLALGNGDPRHKILGGAYRGQGWRSRCHHHVVDEAKSQQQHAEPHLEESPPPKEDFAIDDDD